MLRCYQVKHLMEHDIVEQVLGLFDQLGVDTDITGARVAASPAGLHALKEVAGNRNL